MADKINILELDINTSALISKMTETRAEIERLKTAQKELTTSNDTNSDAFTKNAVEIGRLQSAYTAQNNVVKQLQTAESEFATATETATAAINKENTSVTAARENNTQLLAIRNNVNTKTVEGQAAITAINNKLDENNAFIKENVSAYEKQKISIGGYSSGIKDAFQAINPLNGGMAGLASRSAEAGGAGNLLKTSLMGTITGMWGMVTASLAFIATPVGAVIALIAGAFLILYEIFKNFKPLLNPILDAFAALGAIFETLKTAIFSLVTGSKSLGETFSDLGGNMSKAAEEAYKLATANRELIASQRSAELSTAKLTTQIQGLILNSKDLTKSEAERAAFAQKAINLEETKQAILLTNSNKAIAAKRMEIMEGKNFTDEEAKNFAKSNNSYAQKIKNDKNLDQDKINDLRKLEVDRQTILQGGQAVTEKLQNRQNKMIETAEAKKAKSIEDEKKANDKATADAITVHSKQVDAIIKKDEDAIKNAQALYNSKKHTADEELKFEQDITTKKLALNQKEYDLKKISLIQYQTNVLNINTDFNNKKEASEKIELEKLKEFEDKKSKLVNELAIDKAKTEAEKETIKLTQNLTKEVKELEALNLSESKKYELKTLLLNKYNADVDKIATKAALAKAQKQADFDKKEINFEKQKTDAKIALAQQLGHTLLSVLGDSLGAQLAAIALDAIIQVVKIEVATAAAAAINTANGVALSIPTFGASVVAATAENVALEASSAFQIGAVIASSAISGLGAIAKRADGGAIPTLGAGIINNGANLPIPLSNGDNTLVYVKQGEMILNEKQQAAAGGDRFFQSIGVPMFAGGGVVGGNSNVTSNNAGIDLDLLANKIAQANRYLPTPVVSVQDIAYQQHKVAVLERAANF